MMEWDGYQESLALARSLLEERRLDGRLTLAI
jgi:hypothetical protein